MLWLYISIVLNWYVTFDPIVAGNESSKGWVNQSAQSSQVRVQLGERTSCVLLFWLMDVPCPHLSSSLLVAIQLTVNIIAYLLCSY